MTVYSAMQTAVSGLHAQSRALGHISDNIANSGTIGFKKVETSFSELVTGTRRAVHAPGSVVANARYTHDRQGDLQQSQGPLHMSVTGDGYFMVAEENGQIDGEPTFEDVARYSRRGDFELDDDGFVVNGGGYYLQGLPVDPATGNPTGAFAEPLRFEAEFNPPRATSVVGYNANLPQNSDAAGGAGTTADDFAGTGLDVLSDTISDQPGAGEIPSATFVDNSLGGGALTLFNDVGEPLDLQIRWAKLAEGSGSAGGTDVGGGGVTSAGDVSTAVQAGPANDLWGAYYFDPAAAGGDGGWNFMTAAEFDTADGTLRSDAQPTLNGLTLDGSALPEFTLDFTSGGVDSLTQFADANGQISVNRLEQDGHAKGELAELFIDDNGMISATFSNGNTRPLAKVPLVAFPAQNALDRLDGGAFIETPQSGAPIMGASGEIVAGTLETSNVDIAEEFTRMITAQRSYSANSKIVQTADQMLQEVMNIRR